MTLKKLVSNNVSLYLYLHLLYLSMIGSVLDWQVRSIQSGCDCLMKIIRLPQNKNRQQRLKWPADGLPTT